MSKIANDLVAKSDILKRRPFAKNIVSSLVNSFEQVDESIVVGICGKWGSGKSTLINYIEAEIESFYGSDNSKYKIIQFNSWANSNEKDLQRALLETILKNVEQISWKTTIKNANEKIKKYLRYLDHVKYLKYAHPVIMSWFNGIEQFRKKNETITIDELKDSVNALIETNKLKLFITIDDLDRLDHTEIVSVFKALKLSVNFVNTIFFVAYDKQVVVNALKDTYGVNAEEYLEKIIQVDFSVPELMDEQVEVLFFDRMREIIKENELEVSEPGIFSLWKYHGLRQFFQNARDIKRYTNSLILSLPNVKNNVNILDFLALEAIKVFDYDSYNKLYESLLDHKRASIMGSVDLRREYLVKFVSGPSKILIDYLFDLRNSATMFTTRLIHKRLKDTEYFQRYFALNISSKDVTEEELMNFINAGTNKRQVLENAFENDRISNLLRRISDKRLSEKVKFKDEYIFRDFLNFWENKKVTSTLDELIWHAYFNICHSFDDPLKGAKLAVEALEMNINSEQPMRLVFNHFIFLFKHEGRVDSEFYGALPDQLNAKEGLLFEGFVANMKKLYGTYFHKINSRNHDFSCIVFIDSFSRYCPEQYKVELTNVIQNSAFIIFLLRYFFIRVDASTNTPFALNLSKRQLLLPGDLFDKFIEQVKTLKEKLLTEEDWALVVYFNENIDL